MSCIPSNNECSTLYFGYVDLGKGRSAEKDPVLLLIEEVIDYSLRHHNVKGWKPPVDLDVARQMNKFTYFNENFAATVVSPDTEVKALNLAKSLGFDDLEWLNIADPYMASLCYDYLWQIYHHNAPDLSQVFSFACYAIRMALERKREHLANVVVSALLGALRSILKEDVYFMDFYFIPTECTDQDIDNQENDIDEGFGRVEEEDISKGNDSDLPLIYIDPILLFVVGLINFSLRFVNLRSWIPMIDLEEDERAPKTEMVYFTEDLGTAINHPCAEAEALRAAKEHGFDEERWLEPHKTSEERNFQNYIREVLHFNNDKDELRMFSFVAYASKLAMRENRKSLVNEVASALVGFLHEYCPLQRCYREFDICAWKYNALHRGIHSQSDDEGVEDVENETVDSDEDVGTFHEGTAANDNEAEEIDSPFSTVEKFSDEESGIDVSEVNSAREKVLEEGGAFGEAKGETRAFEAKGETRAFEAICGYIPRLQHAALSVLKRHIEMFGRLVWNREVQHMRWNESEWHTLEMQIK